MNRITGRLILKHALLALTLFWVIGVFPIKVARAVELFWNTDGVLNSWTATNWGTSAGGPFTTDWTSFDDAHFTANSFLSADNIIFSNITVDANAVVTLTGVEGTEMGTGGTIATIDVGADGALDLSDTTVQRISNVEGTGFIKNGDGILSMGGSPLDGTPYNGGFTLNAGSVILRTNNTLGTGPLMINGGTLMATAGNRTSSPSSITVGGDFTVGGVTTILNSNNGESDRNITMAGAMDLTGGDRTITIGSDATYTFSGEISNGALTVEASPGATGRLVLSNGGSTFSGGVTVASGTLSLNNNSSPTSGIVTNGPVGTGILTLSGGNLTATGSTRTIANTIEIAAGTTSNIFGSGRNIVLTGPLTGSGTIDNTLDTGGVSNAVFFNGDISGFSGTIIHERVLSETGSGVSDTYRFNGLTEENKDGSQAKFVLNGSADTSSNSVVFRLGGAGGDVTFKMGELSGNGNLIRNDLDDDGTLNLEVGHLGTDSSWGGVYVSALDIEGDPIVVSNFTKVGGGTLTLTGDSTYDGVTAINGGTLRVNGNPTGGGAYVVSSGATLGGTGSVGSSSITVDAGGTLAPGEGVGTLDVGGDAHINGTLEIEFGDNAIDRLDVAGLLDITNATVDFSGLGSLASGEYVFATYGTLEGINFANILNLPGTLTLNHDTTNKWFSLVGELSGQLAGDFNNDGVVDAADYIVWRNNLGATNEDALNGNGDNSGAVDVGDYTLWKSEFGNSSNAAIVTNMAAAVPEPRAALLLVFAVAGYFTFTRRVGCCSHQSL